MKKVTDKNKKDQKLKDSLFGLMTIIIILGSVLSIFLLFTPVSKDSFTVKDSIRYVRVDSVRSFPVSSSVHYSLSDTLLSVTEGYYKTGDSLKDVELLKDFRGFNIYKNDIVTKVVLSNKEKDKFVVLNYEDVFSVLDSSLVHFSYNGTYTIRSIRLHNLFGNKVQSGTLLSAVRLYIADNDETFKDYSEGKTIYTLDDYGNFPEELFKEVIDDGRE